MGLFGIQEKGWQYLQKTLPYRCSSGGSYQSIQARRQASNWGHSFVKSLKGKEFYATKEGVSPYLNSR